MNKKILLAFSLFIFLVIPAIALAHPLYQDIKTSLPNGTDYNIDNTYGFEINCSDNQTIVGINHSAIVFSLGRPVGTIINYTNDTGTSTSTPAVGNATNYIFTINFTTGQIGRAGSFNYTWYCENTSDIQNATAAQTWILDKNATGNGVNVTLTSYAIGGTQSNTTNAAANSYEGQGEPYADCTIVSSVEGSTNMWRDGVAWTEGYTGRTSLGIGAFTVKCNTTGNNNFTNNNTGGSYILSVLASGGGGGGGGGAVTTQPTWQLPTFETTGEGWALDQNTVIILVIIAIVILASRKKK